MPELVVDGSGDGCWPDLLEMQRDGKLIDLMGYKATAIRLAVLPNGMTSGRSSVAIRLDMPDGRVLLTETSLRLFVTAADIMRGMTDGQNERDGQPSVTCPKCGLTSFHLQDVENHYCDHCKLFHLDYME